LKPREEFSTSVAEDGEQLLFVWQGSVKVQSQQGVFEAGERETIFISGRNRLQVQNDSPNPSVVIQVQAPPE
jgi:mannose-6-phosphate isomerase-like protein (cupin superfamily)